MTIVGLTDHFAPLRQVPRPYPSHTNALFLRGKSSDLCHLATKIALLMTKNMYGIRSEALTGRRSSYIVLAIVGE